MYYLKLSGFIPDQKQMEFEQTYRLAMTQIPKTCTKFNMTKDALYDGIFSFVSYWDAASAMNAFKQSPVFLMLLGAYNALGKLNENMTGELIVNEN